MLIHSWFACICSHIYIEIRIVKFDTPDYVHFMSQKVVVEMKIDLNTNISDAKTVAALIFRMD